MKKFKTAILGAALSAAGLVAAVPAQASVYFGSGIIIDDLSLLFFDSGDPDPTDPPTPLTGIDPSFTFTIKDDATLIPDGNTDANTLVCKGTSGLNNNDCGPLQNGVGTPVLNLDAANGTGAGSTITRLNDDYSFFGPGTDEYANSNVEITNAQLVNGVLTDSVQVAEGELQVSGSSTDATSGSSILSSTSFTFTFVIDEVDVINGPVTMVVNFDADPDQMALVDVDPDASGNATYSLTTNLKLEKNDGTASADWSPQGNIAINNCVTLGLGCTETADGEDLNTGSTAGPGDGMVVNSWDPNDLNLSEFGIVVTGLTAGEWNLTLSTFTNGSVDITRVEVPEPHMILLLGAGFMVAGIANRRRRKTTV